MKILFLTSGQQAPATRFRVLPWLSRLRAEGHHCVLSHSRPDKYEQSPWLGFRLSQRLRRLNRQLDVLRVQWGQFDVVYLERELFNDPTFDVEARMRHVARRFVLDIDDGIFLNFPDKFAHVAATADCVIAGSDLLADQCRLHSKNVVVIPTCVDTDRYPVKAHEPIDPPTIGWTGTSSNMGYLRLIEPPLAALVTRHPFTFAVIADPAAQRQMPQPPGMSTRFIPWREESETNDLLNFDVGVMPLRDEPWARYKCGLKLLQYMAAGLPAVASPVGVNPQIVTPGVTGFLPSSTEEWTDALERLTSDESLRQQMGQAGRAAVEQRYSIAAHWNAWRNALLVLRAR